MDVKKIIKEWIKEFKSKRTDGYVHNGIRKKLLEIKKLLENIDLEED